MFALPAPTLPSCLKGPQPLTLMKGRAQAVTFESGDPATIKTDRTVGSRRVKVDI